MTDKALRLIPGTDPGADPYDLIRAKLHPDLLEPVYYPARDEATIGGTCCVIDGCEGYDGAGRPRLCRVHRARLRDRRAQMTQKAGSPHGSTLTAEAFVADPGLHRGPAERNHPGFDFTGIPETLALELRLLVQARRDRDDTILSHTDFTAIKRVASGAGLQSLIHPEISPEGRWLRRDMPIPSAFEGRQWSVRAHVRFAGSVALDVGWPVPLMDRDRWYPHDFDVHSPRARTLSWAAIEQPWFKRWAKEWAAHRINTGWKFTTAVSSCTRLLWFSRFLAQEHPYVMGPQDLTRALLLDYIAWVKRQPNIATSQRQNIVSAVRVLVEDHRLNGWSPRIPEAAILRHGELPKRAENLPKPIPPFIHRQITSADNLALASPELRTQLLILDGHGFRLGTLVELSIDCLGEDADGFPTIRYRNTKRERERLHPVRDPQIVEAIQEQRQRALLKHPETPWLFPAYNHNAHGRQHATTSAIRTAISRWMEAANIRDQDGNLARITPHQFRHTFGTRELNNGAPQEVVQELLDHDDPAMTRGYARLTGERLKQEFISAARFNAAGERLQSLAPDSALADVAWMKEQMNRAKVTLPNGYCALPLQQTCEVQNACLDCQDYFVTTPEFIPAHEAQRERTVGLIDTFEAAGQTRMAEKNRQVLVKLDTLLETLRSAR
ncbi:tyrosine-type recombinase/integrase [Streptomyces sp. NPDC020800]|uniref:tyrosine-type recombinase/integrase n=1 Tax=Streptomyces sp. NPDC020800 TaxID=3365092 RepID=UPI0037A7A0BA